MRQVLTVMMVMVVTVPLVVVAVVVVMMAVEMVVAESYGNTVELYTGGEAEIVLLTPLLYVQAEASGEIDALAMTDPVVMSGHEAVLLVAPGVAAHGSARSSEHSPEFKVNVYRSLLESCSIPSIHHPFLQRVSALPLSATLI